MTGRASRRIIAVAGLTTVASMIPAGAGAQTTNLGTPTICTGTIADNHSSVKITVSGPTISFEGPQRAIINGFNFRAFITSPQYAFDNSNSGDNAGFFRQSYYATFNYGQEQIDAMKAWGMNTVRFQVSQSFMGNNDAGYRKCLVNAVRMARNSGLMVILAMQWQKNPDDPLGNKRMPTQLTKVAWRNTNDQFKNDPGVIYDLFNEPGIALHPEDDPKATLPDAADRWRTWLSGDSYKGADSEGFIGHQQLVNYMRDDLASTKLLIVEGLSWGDSYEGVPETNSKGGKGPIYDRLGRLAYSTHPYARGYVFDTTLEQLDGFTSRWGFISRRLKLPVIVTEWLQGAGETNSQGVSVGYRLARDLINYVNNNNIPAVVSAFDVKGPMNTSVEPKPTGNVFQPSNFDNWLVTGTTSGNGTGILVCRFFRHGYEPDMMYTDEFLRSDKLDGERDTSPCLVKAPE